MGSMRRRMRAAVAAAAGIAIGIAVGVGVSGCSAPGADEGERVADWIAGQEHVIAAEASVSEDPWNRGLWLSVRVEPTASDDELVTLAAAAENRAEQAGWEHPTLLYDLGDGRSFSNTGGPVTLEVFLGMRHDSRYAVASARGVADCAGIFCVTLAESAPEPLLAEVKHLLDLADEAGGVQSNLEFSAESTDGRFIVSAEPSAPIDDAVDFWQRLASRVPIVRAQAWSIEPVGDLPPLQTLDLTVANEESKAAVERIAAEQALVDVRVDVLLDATPSAGAE